MAWPSPEPPWPPPPAPALSPSALIPPAAELPVDHEVNGDKPDANCRQLHGQHEQGGERGDVHPLHVVQQRRTLVPRHASGRGREPWKGEPAVASEGGETGGAQRQHQRRVERGPVEAAAAEEGSLST